MIRYKVDSRHVNLNKLFGNKTENKTFSGKPLNVELDVIGYISGKHIVKALWLNQTHFEYLEEVGEYPHVIKKETVKVYIAKVKENSKKAILMCKP